nr:immunoglobulin heavy chain junction region [Macaca mulatta]MOY28060.1 immunoglobulin heavy chain junction region [Macaca mulatta]MOY29136.1 immunoglobulin heavy chain junction region [Macaca mulatta]
CASLLNVVHDDSSLDVW